MGVEETQDFLESDPTMEAFLIFTNEDRQWETWSSKGFEEITIKQ
jgi:hypothetical protein